MTRLDAQKEIEREGGWMSPVYQEFLPYEANANRMRVYGGLVIPGLLQAKTYIEPVNHQEIVGRPNPEIDIAQRALRLRRQKVLDELKGKPGQERVSFVVSEAAVHQMVTDDPRVRIQQIDHLIDKSYDFPVRLLPFTAAHVGPPGIITEMVGPYGPSGEEERVIAWESHSPDRVRGGILRPTPPEQVPGPFEAYDRALAAAEAAALSLEDTRIHLDDLMFRFKGDAGLLP